MRTRRNSCRWARGPGTKGFKWGGKEKRETREVIQRDPLKFWDISGVVWKPGTVEAS